MLYSIAVVAKFRPEFATTHKAAILAITRDIASADANEYALSSSLFLPCGHNWKSLTLVHVCFPTASTSH